MKMESTTRRTLLANAALGIAALSGVTALLTRPAGAAASPDNGGDSRDNRRRHDRRHHDRHDHHRHDHRG
jgi:ABC-type Zn2+ transport system substrate-binding protein/surface adhesin